MRRALLILTFAASAPAHWKAHVPAGYAAKVNPYYGDSAAVAAGAKLFQQHCAACHGQDARGLGCRPNLHSPMVASAPPGALFWLLRNGSMRRGMPSFSKLPDQQRWQIITWLKSLSKRDEGFGDLRSATCDRVQIASSSSSSNCF